MEPDYLFSIHRDFNHRTRGVTASSMQSTVGAYHLNVPLCQRTLELHGWASALQAAGERLRRGQADIGLALSVEVSRRRAVRQLVEDIFAIVKGCCCGVAAEGSTPGTGKGNRPSAAQPSTTASVVMAHHINELLTGWILHERNDPHHEALVAQLRVVPTDDKHDDPTRGYFLTSAALYDTLYPVAVERSFVLASDVGHHVIARRSAEDKSDQRGGNADEKNDCGRSWVLTSVVNQWRGVLRENGSSTISTADGGGQVDKEEELADWELAVPAREIVDVVIPSSDLEPRGSSTAVFVRCAKWCGGDKARAATAAREIAQAARRARGSLYDAHQAALATSAAAAAALRIDPAAALRSWVIVRDMCTGSLAGESVELVELRCGNIRCPMLLRAWHKMRALYDAATAAPSPSTHTSSQRPGDGTTGISLASPQDDEEAERAFDARLLIVLLRYASLCGASVQNVDQTAGFHAAVPPRIYALLREHLNTVVEGFASPMNATSTRFCSLFPDCDSYFGSVGSFFHLNMVQHFPRGVSMSCNPPYSVIVMLRVSDQLSKLYEDAEAMRVPLQVFVVVCNWEQPTVSKEAAGATSHYNSGATILHRLRTHKFCQRHVSLEPRKAPFQDGHAFVLNRPFFTLASNTEVYLFQNSYAHEAWPSHRHEAFDRVVHEWSTLEVSEARQQKKRERNE